METDIAGPGRAGDKILGLRELLARREAARLRGQRVVHCHGCFDLVHPGHVRHLRFARAQGDVLLVSITNDAGVGKGAGRPLIPEELRAENLAELDCVGWVHVCEQSTAVALLEAVRPDVYIKGAEYETNHDPRFQAERACVERHGGRVVFSSGDVVFSSTALIESIARSTDPFHARLRSLLDDERLASERLGGLIASFRGQRVVVVGEVIRDTYVFCDRPNVAGESPVMTLRPMQTRAFDGGAAIIARHAAALGASPVLVTALPDDDHGRTLRARLEGEGVTVRAIHSDQPIAEKERFLVGPQKVMKVDRVERAVLDARTRDALVATAEGAAREHPTDAVIVADFGLGLFSSESLRRLTRKLRGAARVVTGDVSGRRSGLRDMRWLDLVCPSEEELREAYRSFDEALPAVTWRLLSETQTRAAIVTMGPEGLVAFDRLPETRSGGGAADGAFTTRLKSEHAPAVSAHAVDALGCGDALLTTATLALARDASLLEAGFLGSFAAGLEAARLGNVPIGSSDLRREVARLHGATLTFAPEQARSRAENHTAIGAGAAS